MDNITFIVKTFERFYCVKRLVKSILKKYPDATILIADDSAKSCKQYFENSKWRNNIKVIELETDCGLSKGRNALIDMVETDYFLLLDDDFVFDKKTDINRAMEIIKKEDLDILGGFIRNYTEINSLFTLFKLIVQRLIRYEKPANYIGSLDFDEETKTLYVKYIRKQFPLFLKTDIVMNFFVAKTKTIRDKNRWDDELKLQEHTAFFFSAKKKGLKIAFSNEFSVQHRPIKLKKYSSFRGRNFVKIFMEKNDIQRIVATYDNEETVVTDYAKL